MSQTTRCAKTDIGHLIETLQDCLRGTDIGLLEWQGPGVYLRLQGMPAPAAVPAGASDKRVATVDVPLPPQTRPLREVRAGSVGVLRLSHPLHQQALVHSGQKVQRGQTLALLQIGMALLPVPAPGDGVIGRILAAEGAVVGYGTPLLEIDMHHPDSPEAHHAD